jgi:hypothetical protein
MFAYHTSLPTLDAYDLVVCGGGPSGIPAALAAARSGLKALLVEQTGQLGGTGTSAGVSHLLGGRTSDNRAWCVAGIFKEIVEDLTARGGAIDPRNITADGYSPHGWGGKVSNLTYGVPFDPIQMALLLDEKLLEASVDVLYFTGFVDCIVSDEKITHLVLSNKSGLQVVPCKAVVDATGDADVAARSGCRFTKGRDSDGLMTPATLMFHVDHVDQDQLAEYINHTDERRFGTLIKQLRSEGKWDFPYEIFISVQLNEKGTLMINTTRICDVDGTDGRSISRGMMQGRREVTKLFTLMRQYFPGFANARIKMVAPVLGIRETRRIIGDFVLCVDDLIQGRSFEDTIGFSGYGWDLPDPKKPSYQPMHCDGAKTKNDYLPIPYRVMVPRPVQNVICPGRAISVERDVLGPLREMAPCYAMGHAAGLAGVQVVNNAVSFSQVDIKQLQQELATQGAVVNDQSLAIVQVG